MDLGQWFDNIGRETRLKKGEILFLRGDEARGPFILLSGRVRLYRQDENGREITLHQVRPGERFAEASVFSEIYHCDCMADEDSTILTIPKTEIIRALKTKPAFASEWAQIMARQVMSLRAQLELRNIRSAEERLYSALLLKAGEAGIEFEMDETLKAFAAEIGLTHEALYRALRKLEDGGRLKRDGASFVMT